MPRLITSSKILRSSVSFSKKVYDRKTGKAKEVMVRVYFPNASSAGTAYPVTVPHSLGKVPVQASPVKLERDPAAGPPGVVYTLRPWATSTRATFHCSTDNTWADIVLR